MWLRVLPPLPPTEVRAGIGQVTWFDRLKYPTNTPGTVLRIAGSDTKCKQTISGGKTMVRKLQGVRLPGNRRSPSGPRIDKVLAGDGL